MILAFVYLGHSLPKYVLANMRQISKNHPSYRLVFIGDNSAVCKKIEELGFEVWRSPDPEMKWEINRQSLSHNPEFRDGFWFKTLARFFALNEFLKNYPESSCLLIESDVWISSSFPMQHFELADFDFAYPLTTLNQGVASTFFISSTTSLQRFIDYAKVRVLENPASTDVTILAEFRRDNPNLVFVLPSGPNKESAFNLDFAGEEIQVMSDSKVFPGQFFDASTWGQFLTGEDPRNAWGIRIIYHAQAHHAVNPSKFRFRVSGKSIYADIDGASYQIHSLHVHSKDIRVFENQNFVASRLSNYQGRLRREIVWKYFLKFVPYRIKFEIKRLIR